MAIELSKEELSKFKSLPKHRRSFWFSNMLMSDRARFIISTPHLSKQLSEEIRKQRNIEPS